MSEERLVRPLSLTMIGSIEEEGGSILQPKKSKEFELILPCKEITIKIERRIQRTVIRGGEGDDLLDEGSESAVYDVLCTASVSEYNELMSMFHHSARAMWDLSVGPSIICWIWNQVS